MSESKSEQTITLKYDNWYVWDPYIMSAIRRENAYLAFDSEPVDPRTQQRVVPPATTLVPTPSVTTTPQPTNEELKAYREELKEWKAADDIAAGVILSSISDELQHVVDPTEPAKLMYDKLKAEVVKQPSNSVAHGLRIELVYKQFKDIPTMENFEKHLIFYRWSRM